MTADFANDAILRNFLATAQRAPDERFVTHIERLVRAEQVIRRARQAALRRFATELVGTLSVGGAYLMIRSDLGSSYTHPPLLAGPSIAALMLLLVWVLISTRSEYPPTQRRSSP